MPEANPPDTSAESQTLADEALTWLVRLHSGHASEDDRRQCQIWRTRSPAHLLAYREAEALWHDVGNVRSTPGPTSVESSPLVRLDRGLRSHWKTWALAACILLTAGVLWIGNVLEWTHSATADYRTDVGEQRVVALEDGSRIQLNTDTAVNVALSGGRRDLYLLRGEASFTVARDPDRPFTVSSGNVQARALGTAFAIRHRTDMITVTVMEHTVQVDPSSATATTRLTVHEGEQVHYAVEQGDFSQVRQVDLGKETAWQRGKVIFETQSLAVVVEELNRYRHGRIIILNPALRALNVTGVFDVNDPDAALRMIQDTLHIRETSLTPYLVLLH